MFEEPTKQEVITEDKKQEAQPHIRVIQQEPVKFKIEKFVSFINALFNNKGFSYLKSIASAAEEANISLEQANAFFHKLETTMGGKDKVYLIEHRADNNYYPNYTKQYIVNLFENAVTAKERK